jgi:hypothetical protein
MNVGRILVALVAISLSHLASAEPLGTAFTYQGELKQLAQIANGDFDFQFELYDVPNGGVSVVSPVQLEDVAVNEGVFTVELDFGSEVFDGEQLWLEVGVREGGLMGAYSTLEPRQKLTATPYALNSLSAGGGSTAQQRTFVGYSTGTIVGDFVDKILWETAELCRTTFGANATMATSKEVRSAIDDGSFFFPSGTHAIIRPFDLQASGFSNEWFDPHLHAVLPITELTPHMILAHTNGNTIVASPDVQGLKVACSQ